MATWPTIGPVVPPVLSPWFDIAQYGYLSTTNTSQAWGTANRAWFYPLFIPEACLVTKLWWQNGTTASGNVDCGLYDEQGNRLISTGATAQAGISAIQSVDITDTAIPPGLIYLALALSSAAGTIWTVGSGAALVGVDTGIYLQLSAMPLPNPATLATTLGTTVVLYKFGALVAPRTVL